MNGYIDYRGYRKTSLAELQGMTLSRIDREADEAFVFHTEAGRVFRMWHDQDCCEIVYIDDVIGELDDLIGSPLLLAEESVSAVRPEEVAKPEYEPESQTWTFYRFRTIKGLVDIRWFGESNGCYSESVEFAEHVEV